MAKDDEKKGKDEQDSSIGELEEARSEFDAIKEAGEDFKVKVYYKGRGKLKAWKADFDTLPEEAEILELHKQDPSYWPLGTYKAVLIAYDKKGKVSKDREITMNIGTFNSGMTTTPFTLNPPKPTNGNGHDRQDFPRSFRDEDTGQVFYEEPRTGRTYTLDPEGNKIYDRISRLAEDNGDEGEFEIRPEMPIRGKDDLFMLMMRQMQVDAKRSTEQQSDMFKFMMQMNQQNMQMLVTVLSSMSKAGGGNMDIGSLMTGMSNMVGTLKGVIGGGEAKEGGGLMDMIGAVAPIITSLLEAGKTPQQAVAQVQADLQAGKMPQVKAPDQKRIEQPAEEVKAEEKKPTAVPAKPRQKTRAERKAEKENKEKKE